MQLLGPKIKTNEKELTEFLDHRIFELGAVARLVQHSNGDAYFWLRHQKKYARIKEQLDQTSIGDLYKKLYVEPQEIAGPFATDQVADVVFFIENCSRKFESVLNLPEIWRQEKLKRQEEFWQREQQLKAERKAKAEAKVLEQKKVQELQVAQSLGIKPETLEKLQTQ